MGKLGQGRRHPAKWLLAAVLCGCGAASAQSPPLRYVPLKCEQLTSLSAATPLSAIPASADMVAITVETHTVRYRDDGTAPTSSVGNLLPVALLPWQYTGALSALQFIETTSGAVIDACFYRTAG